MGQRDFFADRSPWPAADRFQAFCRHSRFLVGADCRPLRDGALAGALLYIAQTANVALGASALFALGIGKGLPLIAFATLGAGTLPRAGAWMETVKQIFGFSFLATAIFMAAPLLPPGVDMVLWALLLFGTAGFAFLKIPGRSVVARTIGTAAFVYGVILMLGVASGGKDPLQPLAAFGNRGGNQNLAALQFTPVETVSSLQEKLVEARGDKPTLIYFTADWCVSCSTVERRVLPDDSVKKALGGYQLIKADISQLTSGNADLMAKLGRSADDDLLRSHQQGTGGNQIGGRCHDRLYRTFGRPRER